MLALVIDTATAAVTAGVISVDFYEGSGGAPAPAESLEPRTIVKVLATRGTVDGKAHNELLSPSIAGCLADAKVTPADLDAVIAGVGPGPFTGLRVGLATATAFGHALGIPTYGVCTLDALAHGTTGRLLVATDARRKELYFGIYADGERVTDPSVGKPAEISGDFEAAVGAGAHMYPLGVPVLDTPMYPTVRGLGELAIDRVLSGAPDELLTPMYLRRPDAVPPGTPKKVVE